MIEQQLNKAPRHVVILAHPDPGSFNGAIAELYCRLMDEMNERRLPRTAISTLNGDDWAAAAIAKQLANADALGIGRGNELGRLSDF